MRPFVFIILFATLSAVSVSTTVLEKIFVHERGQGSQDLRKSGRFEETDEFEYITRAIEEFAEKIPKYTGFYFLDFLFEVAKNACIFFLALLAPVDQANVLSMSSNGSSSNSFGVIDNTV